MSRLLAELTEANEPFFSMALHDLETATGSPGVDVHLTMEVIAKVQEATQTLELDPGDTSPEELYSALSTKFIDDNEAFAKQLGVKNASSQSGTEEIFERWFKALPMSKNCWVIKKSAVKKLLKIMPPTTVMKILSYKSLESMLKRENVSEILIGIKLLENEAWLHKFNASFKKLKPSDFEIRAVELLQLDAKHWAKAAEAFIATRGHNIAHTKEGGAVAILPAGGTQPGLVLAQAAFIVHYTQEIRVYSSLFKHRQVHRKFGTLLADTLSRDPANAGRMVGQDVHWRLVHRHFGSRRDSHPSVFEPNVQPEELSWQHVSRTLAGISDTLGFWEDMEAAGIPAQTTPVSINILDVARNVWLGLKYEQRTAFYLRLHIWNELLLRYMEHEVLEQQIIAQLDNDLPLIESVNVNMIGRTI